VTLASVHTFGLGGAGGGPRIMRALLADPEMPVLSIATGVHAPPPTEVAEERQVLLRPRLGRIDGSRYSQVGEGVGTVLAPVGARRLAREFRRANVRHVHTVAHGPEFWPALQAARSTGASYAISVHDDLRYLLRNAPFRRLALHRLGAAWRTADVRFVISKAMGAEYNRRYGERPYEVITDGLLPGDLRDPRTVSGLRIYFAGLFHRGYTDNLRSLAAALDLLADEPGEVRLTMRCGTLPERPPTRFPLEVLDFGPEAAVQRDLESADLLYLPLMFGVEYRDMVDFSLSTKLVTYLGSGLPILYHGPARGAAYELLAANDAAILATSEHPAGLAETIRGQAARSGELVANAQALARRDFMLEDQRRRFWAGVRSA
jgi:hypothetical protein